MARNRKTNRKDFFAAIIAILLVVAVFSIVSTFFSEKSKKISPLSFSLGRINADGSVSASETSICSDYFECDGLKIYIDPDKKADYWVFYYDENKTCIGSTAKLSYNYGTIGFDDAKYARIFIVPELKEGKEKIRSWEVFAYANILTVIADK